MWVVFLSPFRKRDDQGRDSFNDPPANCAKCSNGASGLNRRHSQYNNVPAPLFQRDHPLRMELAVDQLSVLGG